jgi:Rhs element Vgr protein
MNNARLLTTQSNRSAVSFSLKVGGEVLPTSLEVTGITVLKEVNRIPMAKLVILDGDPAEQDFEVSNEDWFVVGNKIEIFMGDLNDELLIFKGFIVKLQMIVRENATHLEVDCRDAVYRMTLHRQSRFFENKTDSNLAERILAEYNINNKITSTPYRHPQIVQYDVTDWDFVIMRMDFNGMLTIVEDGTFKAAPPDFEQEVSLNLEYGATVIEFDGELEVRNQFEQVITRSWDPATQKIIEVDASEPNIQHNGNLSGKEIASANRPPTERAAQQRAAQEQPATIVHRHGGRVATDELQTWANARLLKDRLSRTRGRVQFEGFNGVKPGDIITLGGFGDRFNGPVYVAGVRQELYEGTWLTDVEFGLSPEWFAAKVKIEAPPAAGMLAGVHGLQAGVVTQIEGDPDQEHRIRVRYPIVDDQDPGIWARVATLDAGSGRGTVFRPEVRDEVIVGFINNDPRDPVVLGMLQSSGKAAPFAATRENNEKGYVSRSGIRLVFHDEENKSAIELKTPSGNQLLISDENQGITLSDQHGNTIRMDKNGISLNSPTAVKINAEKGELESHSRNLSIVFTGEASLSGGSSLKLGATRIDIN